MAANLIRAGYSMTVTNRTRAKADPLLAAGAEWAERPADVAAVSDVVFSMVGYPADVREVILGKEGVLAGFLRSGSSPMNSAPGEAIPEGGMPEIKTARGKTAENFAAEVCGGSADGSETKRPKVIVDMTTSSPRLAQEINLACRRAGIESLDAPVSGGDVGAKNGTLSIMIGGETSTVGRLRPLFSVLGQTVIHQGPAGSGQHAKMVNQILIAGNMAGLCEAFLYAFRSGLDMKNVFASVEKGAAGSWSLSNLGPRILRDDFRPGFMIDHFIKDMGIALDEAGRMNLRLPTLDLVRRLYQAVTETGGGRDGTQALLRGLAALSDVDLTPFIPSLPFLESSK